MGILKRKTGRAAAFTLVEVLTVVVVLGIVVAAVMPQIGSRDDVKAASAARVVMADLAYAQNRAISTQRSACVRFDTTANSYAVYDVANDGSLTTVSNPVTQSTYTQRFGINGSSFETVVLDSATGFDSLPTLMFDSLGSPHSYDAGPPAVSTAMSTGKIVLRSGTYSLTVLVEPYTGELSVQ